MSQSYSNFKRRILAKKIADNFYSYLTITFVCGIVFTGLSLAAHNITLTKDFSTKETGIIIFATSLFMSPFYNLWIKNDYDLTLKKYCDGIFKITAIFIILCYVLSTVGHFIYPIIIG